MDRRLPFALHAALAALAALAAARPASAQTRLLRQPTISATHVAFAYANNIWTAPRDGGDARRVTTFQGVTTNPRFSPDGKWIAFSGQYAGNTDAMLVPLSDTANLAPLTSSTTNQALGGFMNQLVALRDALTAGDSAALTAAQTGLMASEDLLVSALAEHGAVQMRIEVNRAQQVDLADSIENLVSGETSADLPETIVRLNQSLTAYQAALQSSASIMRISLLDYIQ